MTAPRVYKEKRKQRHPKGSKGYFAECGLLNLQQIISPLGFLNTAACFAH